MLFVNNIINKHSDNRFGKREKTNDKSVLGEMGFDCNTSVVQAKCFND